MFSVRPRYLPPRLPQSINNEVGTIRSQTNFGSGSTRPRQVAAKKDIGQVEFRGQSLLKRRNVIGGAHDTNGFGRQDTCLGLDLYEQVGRSIAGFRIECIQKSRSLQNKIVGQEHRLAINPVRGAVRESEFLFADTIAGGRGPKTIPMDAFGIWGNGSVKTGTSEAGPTQCKRMLDGAILKPDLWCIGGRLS